MRLGITISSIRVVIPSMTVNLGGVIVLYEIHNMQEMKAHKKNLIVFLLDNPWKKDVYLASYLYVLNNIRLLLQNLNIIIVTKNRGTKWLPYLMTHAEYGNYAYIEFNEKFEHSDSTLQKIALDKDIKDISNTFTVFQNENSWLLENLVGTISSHFIIPDLGSRCEMSHDKLDGIHKRGSTVEKLKDRFFQYKLNRYDSFNYHALGFPLKFMLWILHHYSECWHYAFCHEAESTWVSRSVSL